MQFELRIQLIKLLDISFEDDIRQSSVGIAQWSFAREIPFLHRFIKWLVMEVFIDKFEPTVTHYLQDILQIGATR